MRGSRFGDGLGIGFRAGFEVMLGPKCKAKCLELDSAPRLRSIPRSPNVLSDLGPSLGQEFETRGFAVTSRLQSPQSRSSTDQRIQPRYYKKKNV